MVDLSASNEPVLISFTTLNLLAVGFPGVPDLLKGMMLIFIFLKSGF